jgi:hypothetical protein
MRDMIFKGFVAFLGILLYLFPLTFLIIFSEYVSTYIYFAAAIYLGLLIYLLPGILINFTRTYEFNSMFHLSKVISKAASIDYILAFFFGLFWFVLLNVVLLIDYLGVVLFLFTKPAAIITCFTLMSKVMNKGEKKVILKEDKKPKTVSKKSSKLLFDNIEVTDFKKSKKKSKPKKHNKKNKN